MGTGRPAIFPGSIVLLNAYSIDAALVAVGWQGLLLMGHGWGILPALVLGLSVWLAFTFDHLLDVDDRDEGAFRTVRHRLHARNRDRLLRLSLTLLWLDLVLAVFLFLGPGAPRFEFAGALAVGTGAYLIGANRFENWPKEPLIGVLMAAGVLVFHENPGPAVLFTAVLFGVLCSANSKLVALRESGVRRPGRRPGYVLSLLACGIVVILSGVSCAGTGAGVYGALPAAVSASSLGLAIVAALYPRIAAEDFRILADLCLLVPPWLMLLVGWAS
jgi:hypothetical protein